MPGILFGRSTAGKVANFLHLPKRLGANQLCNEYLHYEQTPYSILFNFDSGVPELLCERADIDHDNHDS